MKIAIISDTHLNENANQLNRLASTFAEVDLLIHAGDYGHYRAYEYLRTHLPFAGVWGNTDDDTIRAELKEKEILPAGSFRIGIFHGHGTGKTTPERSYTAFMQDTVDIIVFGHSHQPMIATKNGVLMLNPGSLTSKRKERWFSYILLTVEGPAISAELKFITCL